MADLKISQLTGASTPLAGTEVLPIVQSSSTKKVATDDLTVKNIRSNATNGILQIAGPAASATRTMTVPDANFTAARTDAANSFTGDQTLSTGNLIQGTAAKGVNFTANTPAAGMTSQLLNWYEEGTWTPNIGGDATYYQQYGYYTRVGRLVTVNFLLQVNVKGTGSAAAISGLPFTSANDNGRSSGSLGYWATTAINVIAIIPFITQNGATSILFATSAAAGTGNTDSAAVIGDGTYLMGSLTYRV